MTTTHDQMNDVVEREWMSFDYALNAENIVNFIYFFVIMKKPTTKILYIIISVLAVFLLIMWGVIIGKTKSINTSQKEITTLRQDNIDLGTKHLKVLNEFEVGQVIECRSHTENIIIHKSYAEAYRAKRDVCVTDLKKKWIKYDDLVAPEKHYRVEWDAEIWFTVSKVVVPEKTVVDAAIQEHTAAQPTFAQ